MLLSVIDGWNRVSMLHPEYAKGGVRHWGIERCCNAQRKYGTCIAWINNAIIPEAGGAKIGIALGLVLVENGLFESGLFLLAHAFATGGQPFLTDCCQYTGTVFAAHDRDMGVGPHP